MTDKCEILSFLQLKLYLIYESSLIMRKEKTYLLIIPIALTSAHNMSEICYGKNIF